MRPIAAIVTILALTLPASAMAGIYQWQDDRGVIHFTDDADRIPARYEHRAKDVGGGKAELDKPKAQDAQASQPVQPVAQSPAADTRQPDPRAKELKGLKEALPEKKNELAKLRRKWLVVKGRNPSKEEVEEYEEKRAKGKATFRDNPYINKSPLSTPAPARAAYYKKLEEIRRDEERVKQLEGELSGR